MDTPFVDVEFYAMVRDTEWFLLRQRLITGKWMFIINHN